MVTTTYEDLVSALQAQDFSGPEAAQAYLRGEEVSIVTAIRVTRAAFGISMGEAKKIVDAHPAWQDAVIGGRPVQNVAIQIAESRPVKQSPASLRRRV
ncbi:hypothetical protein [Herbaspirillum huttiense]|uniref:hypothetical protein n=1 Tax=Herbaspirillum huttiense TaxID=863372 RepID=UPI00054F263F|nr:hypothetical protein [Herbaspirillum sp. B39]